MRAESRRAPGAGGRQQHGLTHWPSAREQTGLRLPAGVSLPLPQVLVLVPRQDLPRCPSLQTQARQVKTLPPPPIQSGAVLKGRDIFRKMRTRCGKRPWDDTDRDGGAPRVPGEPWTPGEAGPRSPSQAGKGPAAHTGSPRVASRLRAHRRLLRSRPGWALLCGSPRTRTRPPPNPPSPVLSLLPFTAQQAPGRGLRRGPTGLQPR